MPATKRKYDRKFVVFYDNARVIDFRFTTNQTAVTSPITDKIRSRIGDVWLLYNSAYDFDSKKIKDIDEEYILDDLELRPSIANFEIRDTEDPMRHTIAFDTIDNEAFDDATQIEFDREMQEVQTHEFRDICYNVNIFEDGSNAVEQEFGVLNLYATANSSYNFYHEKYELTLESVAQTPQNIPEPAPELDLPNFYYFTLFDQTYMKVRRALTLKNRIPYNPQARLDNGGTPSSGNVSPTNNYYTDWSREWFNYASDDVLARSLSAVAMKKIDFSQQDVKKISELYKEREYFPMYNEIEFTTEADAEFGDILEKTNFSTKLQNFIRSGRNALRLPVYYTKLDDHNTADGFVASSVVQGEMTDAWRYEDFVNTMQNDDTPAVDSVYGLSSGTEETRAYRTLMSLIVKGKINRLKSKHQRNYRDIYEGKLAHSEPFSYIVTKTKEGEDNPIQHFHFANTEKSDVIRFVDTQVLYGGSYTYKIHSVNIVFATKYRYSNSSSQIRDVDRGSGTRRIQYSIDITCEPEIMITKDLVYSKTIRMMDKPPLPPEALFVPYKGVSNKISIFLNSSVGKVRLKPVIMDELDESTIAHVRENQGTDPQDPTILFESDDVPLRFTMYRVDEHPTKYEDFIDGKVISMTTGDERINATLDQKQRATTASYCDDIIPNKKYYYCFREQDVHGHYSNPSPVYCVEMYDDEGSIYPKIDIVEFKEPDVKRNSIGVRRFISISPSDVNLFIDDEVSEIPAEGPLLGQEIVLGLEDEKVWNKKFKIRLTSRSTGRKMDFNFSYSQRTKNIPRGES